MMLENIAAYEVSFIYDVASGRFKFVAPEFRAFFQRDPELLRGDELLSLVVLQDREYVKSVMTEVLAGKTNAGFEFRLTGPKGQCWIRLAPMVVRDGDDILIMGVAADITNDVQNEETIKKYANKKNSILNILAHDLRGPLNIAGRLSEMIGHDTNDSEVTKVAHNISMILRQSVALINDLVNREFLDSMRVEVVKKRIDVARKIAEYMTEYRNSEWSVDRTFRFETTPDSIFMQVDEAKFVQVLNNLVTNALKFTHRHGTIGISVVEKDDHVLFTFSDDGVGIPPGLHDKLFEKFTPARRPGLQGEPTLGLGMSVIKTIIDWHGGRIWFESEVNRGTTFYIELPKE